VTASPDGKSMFVSCARAGAIARFDVASRKETARTKLSMEALPESKTRLFADRFGDSPVPVGLHVSADGARVYVATTQSDLVVIVDPQSLAVVDMIATGDEPDGMAVF
ncbi:MAG: hypothetical protein OER88_14455, partial [Planctomycetota bacterium]|nr:hypothetical protein [Planctomycetota bacterium]